MNYCSIILTHYATYDDFGGERAKQYGSKITRKETIRKTIEALRAHTAYPHELIVIDNGGPDDDSNYLLDKAREGIINIYIRNKDNMHFAYARNQGLRLATGNYICIMDNDIEVQDGWLEKCIELLEKYPDHKFIASPVLTPDKNHPRYNIGLLDGNRLNSFAGSPCMVMTKEVMADIGFFRHCQVGGTYWHRSMSKKGYQVILPRENMVEHLGCGGGLDIYHSIKVKKTLNNGEEIDFTNQVGL